MNNNEMLEVFCTNMTKELTNRVNGFIFVRVLDDSDDVQVSIEYRGFKFKYVFENANEYIRYGGSSNSASRMILDKYRSFIMNRYFLKNRNRGFNKVEAVADPNAAISDVDTFTGETSIPVIAEEEES